MAGLRDLGILGLAASTNGGGGSWMPSWDPRGGGAGAKIFLKRQGHGGLSFLYLLCQY